ncbi:IS5 family transposase [Streptomyces triticagri]|uniref:IS5 family transposase n=1 Tax=Streptomyces triticagri TaxID=2293568 RepID=A0A372LZT4_9ACTN|nr:IS5 family transposase [Streptomyces triticagri]RFU83880.1 IS5 family transposase [Streptomyces triticagri]
MGIHTDLTDAQWERLEPFLPASNGRCGRWRDHRQVVNGVLYRLRTGVQWRGLPEQYGPWKTVHERHRRWSADGTWEMLLRRMQAEADAADEIDWDVAVDSTSVRAHQHAAGARLAPPPRAHKGARAVGQSRSGPGGTERPAGGGGAGGEALGRSRGGFTTKIHLSADGRCRVLSLVITPGQCADCTQFQPVMEGIRVPRLAAGRPRTTPNSVSADKGYSNRRTRHYLRRRGIRHTIPEKRDQAAGRARRGSAGGRPPGFDKDRYKKRNTVERAINKLKAFRAVATRYDKRGYVYLGTVTTAALVIWLRS